MSTQRFRTAFIEKGKGLLVRVPFDPNEVWAPKERHHVTGTINGCKVRGALAFEDGSWSLFLGPAWGKAMPPAGSELDVELMPEGPQSGQLAADIEQALDTSPEARAYFESLATFYRKGYINWIESAKRPPTRAARIAETLELLKAGKKQR